MIRPNFHLGQNFNSTTDPIVHSTNTILAMLAELLTKGKTRMSIEILKHDVKSGFDLKIFILE